MLRRFLNLSERNTSDDSLDFTVLFILPFSESLKWNKSSFTFICWISPAWNRVSQLIYPAVWLTFYRGLPLAGSELHGNLYVGFFMFYKPGRFLSTLYLWRILFTLEWKKKTLTWFFRYKKKNWKELACHRSLRPLHFPFFRHFLHILRLLNRKNRLWYIPCLFIIVPAQEREQMYITEDEKDPAVSCSSI